MSQHDAMTDEYRPDRRDILPAAVTVLRWALLDAMRPLLNWLVRVAP